MNKNGEVKHKFDFPKYVHEDKITQKRLCNMYT